MKILYVTSNGGIHDYRFLKKLVEDYEVMLLHYEKFKLIDEIKSIKNLKIVIKKPLINSFPFLGEKSHFRKIYKDFKPDIVHSGYVWQVGILPSVHNIHPHLSMPWGSDILVEPGKSFLKKIIVKKVLNQCDHIQCDAEFVKKKIMDDYKISPGKITVFPWGIDLNLFSPADKIKSKKELGVDEYSFTVIFSRHLAPIYGLNNLLRGFQLFAESKENVNLLLIADGPLRNYTENFIREGKLESKIKLIGRVPNAKLPFYLSASDVYLSPSLSDGSSLSLLEALAMGLGIIVTDVPAIREWVSPDNGLVVPVGESEAIAKALDVYYNDRQLIEKHGAVNKKIAKERADWDKNYLMLKNIYNNIIGRKS